MSDKEQEHTDEKNGQNKEYTIIVNARQKVVSEHKLTFFQIVQLAFENANLNDSTAYTVTYKKGEDKKPEGTMVDGDTVVIKSGMIFNVKETNRS
ncbi:MAG: multiubiquitin domain-containing protein [Thermoleophilia bacterium]